MVDAAGSEAWSYEKMGREAAEQRTTNSITKSTTYTYNLDGSLARLTYPSGRVITYTPGGAGRPLSAVDTANSISYATGALYAPQGAPSSLTLGQGGSFAGIALTYTYNSRLQPLEMKAASSAGTAMDFTYAFNLGTADNGNVIGITNNKDTTRSQSFAYDQLNRITSAWTTATTGTNCWGETYTMDQWANLTSIGALSGYAGCTQENLNVIANTNNQVTATGFSFDASGNMLGDGVNTYGWNAESEIKSAAGVNYTYDGDGNRVQKSNGKLYWYGIGTEILDESDASGNFTDEYVFFGGKRVAHRAVSSGSIYYYAEDFLGTSRVMATSTGAVCYEADFYPFGGERTITNTCPQNYKFEGKERDSETGNDDFGARYYSSGLGRWLSPDWSAVPTPVPYANLTNPQTLNLYAMVGDNPETFADLDGHTSFAQPLGSPSAMSPSEFDMGFGALSPDPSQIGEQKVNPTPNQDPPQAQNPAWSSLSAAQQALVQGGEKAWNSLSSGQQITFAAITHALEVTTLSNNTSALSEVKSVTGINAKNGDFSIGVTWNEGAKGLFGSSGFAWRPGYGHEGENGLTEGRSSTGLHLLFGDTNAGVGHVHVDYRGIGEGHYKQYNSDVRAVGPEKSSGRPINNYERYRSWYGPIPGYVP